MKRVRQRAGPGWGRVGFSALLLAAGCAGDARVELAAADSIDSLAAAFAMAFEEYHLDTEQADDARESAVIAAFVQRVQSAGEDQAERERHAGDFTSALGRISADRRTEWIRFAASQDNVATLREVTTGLRRLAIESLTLSDEARRYLMGLVETVRTATATKTANAGKEQSHVRRDR